MSRMIPRMKEILEENMRSEILRIADDIMIEDGFEGMTLEKIALKLGVARSTIYNYFNNKQAVVDSLVEHNFMHYFEKLDHIIHMPKSAIEKLTILASFLVSDFWVHKHLHQNMMKRKCQPLKNLDFKYYHTLSLEKISMIISQGVRAGEFRNIDPHLGAAIFNGVIRELSIDVALGIVNMPDEKLIDSVMDIVLKGLKQ